MVVKFNIQTLLYWLFCLYAFSMPFELILEIWFNIDTIFKPFRSIIIVIIGVYLIKVFKNGISITPDIREDIFLYAVFLYGVIISLIKMSTHIFNMGLFYNDIFQSGLLLASFFIFKSMNFSPKQVIRILHFFIAGMLANASYSFFNFYFLGKFGRQTGFMDNPNYTALGLVMVLTFLLLRFNFIRQYSKRILFSVLTLFSLFMFVTSGSRTGLVALLIALLFVFFFASFRRKLVLIGISTFVVLLLLPQQLDKVTVGGGPLILIKRINQSLESDEEDVRFAVWEGAINALEKTSYFGLGIGQFKANFPEFFTEESNKLVLEIVNRGYHLSTHNDYFAILTDYGIPGLLFYILFLFHSIKKIIRRMWYPTEDKEVLFLAQLSFIMLSCLAIYGLGAENFQNQLYWFFLAVSTKSV